MPVAAVTGQCTALHLTSYFTAIRGCLKLFTHAFKYLVLPTAAVPLRVYAVRLVRFFCSEWATRNVDAQFSPAPLLIVQTVQTDQRVLYTLRTDR